MKDQAPDLARGNFRININRAKKAGDNQPVFDRGIISTPDDPETRFELKLWAYTDVKGRPFFVGPASAVAADATALECAAALVASTVAEIDTRRITTDGSLQLADHQVMLFSNDFKLKESEPQYATLTNAEKELNIKRPDYWGIWNPGHGVSQVKITAWKMMGVFGPFLNGNTQLPMPGKKAQLDARPDVAPIHERH